MKVKYDPRVSKFIDRLSEKDSGKVFEYVDLFEDFGYELGTKYLKKISNEVWELRPGRIRLFLYPKSGYQIAVHIIYKKSQKISRKDMKIIERRIKQYK